VSVLLPIYNHSRYVAEAVTSVLQQTYSHLELIAWDDGSSDDSWEQLVAAAGDDPRVRTFRHPGDANRGLNATLRAALAEASGVYIAILASDDAFLPSRLAAGVAVLEATNGVACHAGVEVVDENGRPKGDDWGSPYRAPGTTFQQMLVRNVASAPTLLVRRETLLRVGGFLNEPKYEDAYMMLRLAAEGDVHELPQTLARYRITPGSIYTVTNAAGKSLSSYFEVLQLVRRYSTLGAAPSADLSMAINAWESLMALHEHRQLPRASGANEQALLGVLIDAWWFELRSSMRRRTLLRLLLMPNAVGRPVRRRLLTRLQGRGLRGGRPH